MSQVGGLVLIQQQLERLSVHRTLRTLQELLVEAAEEKRSAEYARSAESAARSPVNSVDGWRLTATAKLAGTRWVWLVDWVWIEEHGTGWVWLGLVQGVCYACHWVGVARTGTCWVWCCTLGRCG